MTAPSPNIAITYCRLCNWLLRAAWMGQELLSTFAGEAGSLQVAGDRPDRVQPVLGPGAWAEVSATWRHGSIARPEPRWAKGPTTRGPPDVSLGGRG